MCSDLTLQGRSAATAGSGCSGCSGFNKSKRCQAGLGNRPWPAPWTAEMAAHAMQARRKCQAVRIL